MKVFEHERLSPIEMEALLIALTLFVVGDDDEAIDKIAQMSEVIATRMEEDGNGEASKED